MAKRKPEIKIVSYGIYTPFDRGGRELPRVIEITTRIRARLGIEFGYVLRVRKARGADLHFTIDHPPFANDSGEIAPPFEGRQFIDSNDYRFFLGDTFWEPLADKLGRWTLTTRMAGAVIARKGFDIISDDGQT